MDFTHTTQKNEIRIFLLSIILIIYFGFLFLNVYVLKLEYTLIGVFQEILTIPLMLLSPVLLVFSIRNFIAKRYAIVSYAFLTIILLISLIIVTWGSFFV